MFKRVEVKVLVVVFVLAGLASSLVLIRPVFAAGKTTATPQTVTVAEGGSQVVEIKLTQPIICPSLPDGEVCRVDINFTSSDPSMASISPSTVTFLANEWAQAKTVTVSTTHDFIYTPDLQATVTFTAGGTAPYYTGWISTLPVTITNTDASEFSGSSAFTGSRDDNIPINDLQLTGSGSDVVNVNLFVPSGSLALSTTTGLTFNGQETGKNLNFSGTRSHINAALSTLRFKPGKTADVVLQATINGLANSVYDSANHHVYQSVAMQSYPTWSEANTAAQAESLQGATGYLATITSQHEQSLITRLGSDGWIGGSDSAVEGEWRWADGPEAGQAFWNGDAQTGSAVDGAYAHWVDGMPDNYTGSNSGGENCLQMYDSESFNSQWNDQNCEAQQSPYYIAEFGDIAHPVFLANKDITVHVTTGQDLNDDGTEDADQPHVVDMLGQDNKWYVIEANNGCELTDTSVITESSLTTQDSGFDYPNGLVNFTGSCNSPGANTDIKLYYYDTLIDDLLVRKYDPNNQTYAELSDASLEQRTTNGHNVVIATYHISDGSDLDTDGGIFDQFTDPVGFARVAVVSVPSAPTASIVAAPTELAGTGENVTKYIVIANLVFVFGLGLLLYKNVQKT